MKDAGAVDQPPNPVDPSNWAHKIRTVKDAHIIPSDGRSLIQGCGVYTSDHAYCHDAVLWRRRALMVPAENPTFDQSDNPVKGTYLWGGVLHGHFGHFLVESLGRIWGYEAEELKIDGVLFLEKRSDEHDESTAIAWHNDSAPVLTGFQEELFNQFGIKAPIGVVRTPVQVERLIIPGQAFGMGTMATGTPAFRKFVQSRIGNEIEADGPKKLYISRSAYGARRGGVIGENLLEKRLEQDGYTAFHPQKESLQTQIARYKAASDIVALDGSALHLAAMVAGPDQKIAMIKRRSSPISIGIEANLTSFIGRKPVVVDAIRRNWIRSDRKRVDRFSIAELDFAATGAALESAGMATAADWPELDEKTLKGLLEKLNSETRYSFRLEGTEAPKGLPDGIVAACHGIEVPQSHAVGPKWLVRKINNGRYEKEEIAGALFLVDEGDRVLECGAGIGIVGTSVAHNCKPAVMRSFEANPHLIEVVEATYRRNGVDDRISVTHGALMAGKNIPQKIDFNVSKRFAFSSLDAPQRELSETVSVPVHDFAKLKEDFRPTVLLMDIEGGELDFLREADLSGINVVVMEFHPEVYGQEGMEFCKAQIRKAGLEPVKGKSTETVWAAQRTTEKTTKNEGSKK
ncbi:Methyltransferase, FkbM family [Sulfitobacter noctilucicola]|uniref:FkbM family methyltransferase n=1 Tax=Sulfitobacter noctilucicola TaxID=1342301 RepID=A0A7W6MAP7_9RHOB|nr:FkbM family methyltransferase [Sulfitobacter noctilucicola]KIN63739.1 Methyltransferase, FkbM family [Sulfitobacter noctilucicola]MBB4174752.1 FkbM family methyltransferase [Sulfitobacter noctilucicola]